MSITAIVENGTIKLPMPVPDGTRVEITLPAKSILAIARVTVSVREPGTDRNVPVFEQRARAASPCSFTASSDTGGTPVPTESGAEEDGLTLYDTLKEIIGQAEGLPPDFAAEHDHYLHGKPKRTGP